jgi:transcriptional regulator
LKYTLEKLCEEADISTDRRKISWYAIRHSVGTYMTREEGKTQSEISEEFGTGASNISMIQKAAEQNIKEAHRTVELAKYIRTPNRV